MSELIFLSEETRYVNVLLINLLWVCMVCYSLDGRFFGEN
jgi:hypothetical protein